MRKTCVGNGSRSLGGIQRSCNLLIKFDEILDAII